ncbi:MAG: ABC transporter permease [Crocinitomicaceae bacterium]|nr:ABC transporter permease [Crocinitomicaceae bacterium]
MNDWDIILTPKRKLLSFNIRELLRFKDLIMLFVKRDFISIYKQTILGPLWIILQPLLTSITLTVVFGMIAGIKTGAPTILFMLAGVTVWSYFADCVTKTSDTFIANQNIFGKVYFPRLVVPLSIVITNFIKFLIQLVLFIMVYVLYVTLWDTNTGVQLTWQLSLLPVIIIIMAGLGLGFGLIISSLTTKYRDLRFLIQFGISLAMYASPIVYPLSKVPEKYQWLMVLNPMTSVIETFKYGFFGPYAKGDPDTPIAIFEWWHLAYSAGFAMAVLFLGIVLFNRIEKSFMDTI